MKPFWKGFLRVLFAFVEAIKNSFGSDTQRR